MSTASRARCFSPADMAARRPTPPTSAVPPAQAAAEAAAPAVTATPAPRPGSSLTPGVLHRRERLRPMFQQAMRISRLLPNSRLVALTLLGYSHYETGLIRRHPTTAELAYATGLTKAQVLTQVQILTQRGWLRTNPLPAPAGIGQLAPQLCIPAPVLNQIRSRTYHTFQTD
ncbi:hypothetical protein PV396_24630 [Streptomyces sp. ME02-8801-2C]|uniref:hypothetical protein n=1 Tax=Streptomyces sp. ME02-8801-2C TaxID=3028680 RepID=UPI0029A750D4|nr:hypothetical protein [Streptomyces sp. ME02-8801-2C]MDX3455089.1 hypothetical protein [Streptomyces sp. ME02-8801-2C]